jgi:hypothetical protein
VHLALGGAAVIGGSALYATAEGEHRFFAAVFLFGGLARLLSISISGPPNAFYPAMLVVERHCRSCYSSHPRGRRNHLESKRFSIRYRMHSPHPLRPQCHPISAA